MKVLQHSLPSPALKLEVMERCKGASMSTAVDSHQKLPQPEPCRKGWAGEAATCAHSCITGSLWQKQPCCDRASPGGLSRLILVNMGLMRHWNCCLGIFKAHIYQIILSWRKQSTVHTLVDSPVIVREWIKWPSKSSLSLISVITWDIWKRVFRTNNIHRLNIFHPGDKDNKWNVC